MGILIVLKIPIIPNAEGPQPHPTSEPAPVNTPTEHHQFDGRRVQHHSSWPAGVRPSNPANATRIMQNEFDQSATYFWLAPKDDRYYTLFISGLLDELVDALIHKKPDETAAVRNQVGENTFLAVFDGPVYLVNREDNEALKYAGDDGKLELFPSGNIPDLEDSLPIIDYPTYFTKGIEPHLEWKLNGNLFRQFNGVWVPVTIKQYKSYG